jgi:hypothetical protein
VQCYDRDNCPTIRTLVLRKPIPICINPAFRLGLLLDGFLLVGDGRVGLAAKSVDGVEDPAKVFVEVVFV